MQCTQIKFQERQHQNPQGSGFLGNSSVQSQIPSPAYSSMSLEFPSHQKLFQELFQSKDEIHKLYRFIETISDELHQIKIQQPQMLTHLMS